MIFQRLARTFESWIDPFRPKASYQPPTGVAAFIWHYVSQARGAFLAMLALGGIVAVMEAGLFWFVARLVDIRDSVKPGASSPRSGRRGRQPAT